MKINLKVLGLSITVILVCASVRAEDLNFGKTTPNANEIIEHLKVPAQANPDTTGVSDAPSDNGNDDDYHDVDKGQSRNLVFMNSSGQKAVDHKPRAKADVHKSSISAAVTEAAVSLEVLFDYNSATLTAEAKQKLAPLAQALKSPEMKGLHFKIEGHTDAVGGDVFNKSLSLRRAEAIKDYLIANYGVEGVSIEVEGKGKLGLADPKNPDSEINRRVRIVRLGG